MTVKEMIIGVQLGVDKVGSYSLDTLLNKEIEYYLNKGYREYIRRQSIYFKENLEKVTREDFISNSDASYNLSPLVEEYTWNTLNQSNVFSNAKEVDLSDLSDEMFSYVYSQAVSNQNEEPKACKLISTSEIFKYSKTTYNKPMFRRYPIIIKSNNIVIFYENDSDVYDYSLLYLKEPKQLIEAGPSANQTDICELPSSTHDDIVDITVGIIIEDIKSSRPYEQNQTTIKPDN